MLSRRGAEFDHGDRDVVVVGAGLVGAAVAARLARAGLDSVVLEAPRVAGGATGRCLGLVHPGLTECYSWGVSAYGRQRAREVWALTTGSRARLVEAAQELGVPVRVGGSVALAADEG